MNIGPGHLPRQLNVKMSLSGRVFVLHVKKSYVHKLVELLSLLQRVHEPQSVN